MLIFSFKNYIITFTGTLCSYGFKLLSEITCFQDKKLPLAFLQGGSASDKLSQFLFIWGKSSFRFHFKKIALLDI